jgi:hypothetical protein
VSDVTYLADVLLCCVVLCYAVVVVQVGAHLLKDALGNYILDPLKEQAVQGVIEGAGMQDAAASAGHSMDSAMHFMRKAQELHRIFFT